MKTDVWMPLYWGDLLADTLHLSRGDLGSYMLLIGAYWRRGSALPDDDEALMMAARCPLDEWKKSRVCLEKFFQIGNGVWSHKRIDRELQNAREQKQKQYARTEAATAARLAKLKENVTSDVTSNVTTTPSPSPSPSPKPSSSNVGASGSRLASVCDEDWIAGLCSNAAYAGINVRRELGKMNTWCATHQKLPTRRRFINWLNRCDAPMSAAGQGKYVPNL